jgi:hypothetical protein
MKDDLAMTQITVVVCHQAQTAAPHCWLAGVCGGGVVRTTQSSGIEARSVLPSKSAVTASSSAMGEVNWKEATSSKSSSRLAGAGREPAAGRQKVESGLVSVHQSNRSPSAGRVPPPV